MQSSKAIMTGNSQWGKMNKIQSSSLSVLVIGKK